MVVYEDECCDCGKPCLGEMCSLKRVPHYYCDVCGEEIFPAEGYDEPEEFDGQHICPECMRGV